MRFGPNWKAFLLAPAILAGAGGAAFAQSDYCTYLRAQLAAYGGGGNGGAVGGSEARLQGLYRDLSIAEGQAQALGCRRFSFFSRGGQAPQCPMLLNRVNQLRSAISSLQRPRGGFFSSFNTSPADRIRDEMQRNGCRESSFAGGARTLCVRVCDGYYFPVNFSVDRSRLKRDEAACQAMYPEGQAELFIDGSADGDTDDMVSLDGKRYQDQPYALAYRNGYNAACPAPRARLVSLARVPLPTAKPRPSLDPETAANAFGAFEPKPVAVLDDEGAAETAGAVEESPGAVRVVGPSYIIPNAEPPPQAETEALPANATAGRTLPAQLQ